jgi:hypothetical protein
MKRRLFLVTIEGPSDVDMGTAEDLEGDLIEKVFRNEPDIEVSVSDAQWVGGFKGSRQMARRKKLRRVREEGEE